jgi:hypothetical protein
VSREVPNPRQEEGFCTGRSRWLKLESKYVLYRNVIQYWNKRVCDVDVMNTSEKQEFVCT